MAARPTGTDQATTALELIRQFVDSPTYRALAVEQQCHVREALEHLSQYEAAAPTARPPRDEVPRGPDADEVRAASPGEFTTDVDVN